MAAFVAILPGILWCQGKDAAVAPWEPFQVFVGRWQGPTHGQPGQGTVEREYEFVLNGKFLQVKNQSKYPPQQKNPKGEVHRDTGMISYDRGRKTFVLRQFHGEGFVNQYALDSISPDGKQIVFTSEAIENIPPGWRARETYTIVSQDEIRERFELAEPGKDFEVYSENQMRRKK